MTDRKPLGMPFESWIDKQIREATERGEFDDLPGTGKPLPGAGEPLDDLWWVKQKVRDEGLKLPLPPTLQLRKDAEVAREEALGARSETQARQIVEEINARISKALRTAMSGPPLNLMPFDADEIVREWRARRK
ncbi:DUF1992 domain-containing protein [Nonomuraea sp. NPDC050663]|uniref:DnaJ homologue subfamily C member 28 conserved domain-containing protein n=1 Tax=Nonomuraea soli TaxID=1032476 RepID=A0A7W0CLS6_9ACTN|nr:DUF1992 domain-containing protein [Nonomuraea soli]MBA2893548.1 hypothetical protein [Nonomuraea soli]